jgi:hypothetical protein
MTFHAFLLYNCAKYFLIFFHMVKKIGLAAGIFAIAALIVSQVALAASYAMKVDLKLVSHITAGLPEQDVFVEKEGSKTEVVRVDVNDAKDPKVLAKELFASSKAQEHDPFKLGTNPLGPFPEGADLKFTLEKWLAATGTGT